MYLAVEGVTCATSRSWELFVLELLEHLVAAAMAPMGPRALLEMERRAPRRAAEWEAKAAALEAALEWAELAVVAAAE